MTLLSAFLLITAPWADVFPQQRTFRRALRQALGCLLCMGRRCVSRIIWTLGGEQQSWSADYFLYSRCQWDPQHLFRALIQEALPYCPQRLIGIAIDDTRLRKTGRCIPQAFYQRDPMSPPFHTNLILGLRFLQASVLLPLHRSAGVSARAVPIRFEEVSRIKRPGKKASEEMKQQYRQAVKQYNLSRRFVQVSHQLRAEYDLAGAQDHILVLTVDNSYCNRTCFAERAAALRVIGAGAPELQTVLSRAGRLTPFLCAREIHSGAGAPGGETGMEDRRHFLWRRTPQHLV